ncbi:DNA primase [bacterium]|nr:DNA primase [bacterium]
MNGRISDALLDKIREANDIVSVIGDYAVLRKTGRNFKALCPFHTEKTPSFIVSPEKQIFHCFGCFPSGALIRTEEGFHKIEDIQVGELVLTHRGRFMPVIRILWRPYNGELVEIYTRKSNLPVTLTTDHEVFVIKTKNCQYKSRKTKICQWRCKLNCPAKFFKEYKIEKLPASQLSLNDYLLYPINQEINDVKFINLDRYYDRRISNFGPEIKPIPTRIKVDEKFLKLIGYWIAEGSNHRAYIRFSLGSHEAKFGQEIEELIKDIFYIKTSFHMRKKANKTGLEITACNSKLSNIFENLCGKGAENKHIPFELQNLPPKKQRMILDAIFKGDGYTGKVAKCKEDREFKAITTVSPVLAEQLKDILLRLEISPTVRVANAKIDKNKVRHKTAYTILWQENIKLHFSDIRQINDLVYQILPIRKIVRRAFAENVYNLTVAEDHSYTTPNFVVGNCGIGGNVFNFLMKYENISFPEAVRRLAKKAGIPLPMVTREEGVRVEEKEELYRLNSIVADYFSKSLVNTPSGKRAIEYLRERGIKRETMEKFRLGYAPSSWDELLSQLKEKGFSRELLIKGGLLTSQGKPYFWSRIIFPILDTQDRVVGFGGRILGKGEPKYLNSPQTPIYDKGRILYGLNWAKEAIRSKEGAVVVEGYMDVILPYQEGFQNFIASMGTSLTTGQVYLLKRFSPQVTMLYDADAAGVQATLRSLDLFLEQGVKVKAISLSKGYDPDTFIQDKGREAFSKLLSQALPLIEWRFQLAKSKFDIKTIEGKIAIAEDLLPTIAKERNLIRQREEIKRLSQELSLEEEILWMELKKIKSGRLFSKEALKVGSQPSDLLRKAEASLIQLLLQDESFVSLVQEKLGPDDFIHPEYRRIAQALFDLSTREKSLSPAKIMDQLKDKSLSQIVTSLLMEKREYPRKERALNDLIKTIKDNKLKLEYRRLEKEIKEVLDRKGAINQEKRTRYLELLKYFRG